MPPEITSEPGFEKEAEALRQKLREVEADCPEIEERKIRFRELLNLMIGRIDGATGGDFGYFHVWMREAGYLALTLGFNEPPIQFLYYDRDGIDSEAESVSPPSPKFPQHASHQWIEIKVRRRDIAFAQGFRLNDPTGCRSYDRITVIHRNGFIPEDIPEPIESIRELMLEILHRWVREIDFPPTLIDKSNGKEACVGSGHARVAPTAANGSSPGTRTDAIPGDTGGEPVPACTNDAVLESLRHAISSTANGKSAKPDAIIRVAKVANQPGRAALRTLENAGEYDGFARIKPKRYQDS